MDIFDNFNLIFKPLYFVKVGPIFVSSSLHFKNILTSKIQVTHYFPLGAIQKSWAPLIFFYIDNSMVMTMVTNTNMNMVLPAVGRTIKDHLSRNDQAMSKILYLLCSLRSEESYNNIFLERFKYVTKSYLFLTIFPLFIWTVKYVI